MKKSVMATGKKNQFIGRYVMVALLLNTTVAVVAEKQISKPQNNFLCSSPRYTFSRIFCIFKI